MQSFTCAPRLGSFARRCIAPQASTSSRLFSRCAPSLSSNDSGSTSTSTSSSSSDVSTTSSSDAEVAFESSESSSSSSSSSSAPRKGYRAWLNGDGAQYRHGIKGRTNWIGDTPFPLNPSFKPLPPLSESIKTKIYNAYLGNILSVSASDSVVVRAISSKFGISMARIRAIIRLKELEQSWKDDKKALQTELQQGMEAYLGVKQEKSENWRGVEHPDQRTEILAKKKTAFEMIDVEKGEQPVFLPLLADLPSRSSEEKAAQATKFKASKTTNVPASRPGRASLVFENVAGTKQGQQLEATYDPNRTKRGNEGKTKSAGDRA